MLVRDHPLVLRFLRRSLVRPFASNNFVPFKMLFQLDILLVRRLHRKSLRVQGKLSTFLSVK